MLRIFRGIYKGFNKDVCREKVTGISRLNLDLVLKSLLPRANFRFKWFCFSLMLAMSIPISQFVLQASLSAQNLKITQAQVTKILQGDQVYVRDVQAKLRDIAKAGEQVRTGLSRAELTFNNQAIARLAPNSRMTVGNCGAQLQQGQALFTGAISACTSTVTAAVRGTTYTIDLSNDDNEQFNVLEGEIEVNRINPLASDLKKQWKVKGGENCLIDPLKRKIVIKPLEERQFRRLLKGRLFKGFEQEDRRLARIEEIYTRLYPGRRFPLRRGVLSPNRGHFSLSIRQKRPLLSQVVVRLSIETKRGESFLPERLIGNFSYPINQSAEFRRGMNPEDRIIVRVFNLQNRLLGYTAFELLDENVLVNIILPDVEQAYGTLRTLVATDSDRNNQIDRYAEIYDYYTRLNSERLNSEIGAKEKLEATFVEDAQSFNTDFFNIPGLPTAPTKSIFPDSFTEDLFAIATRSNFPFSAGIEPNLTDNPSAVIPVKPNDSFEVPKEIQKNRQRNRAETRKDFPNLNLRPGFRN
jgi:FecR protein